MNNLTYKPTVFWAWNSEMTEAEIKRDILSFYEQSIGGIFIHARSGLKIEYLGEKWFKAYKLTIEECKKYGIEVWIYDEEGWPSGFAGGLIALNGEDFVIKHLVKTQELEEHLASNRLLGSYKKVNNKWTLCLKDEADCYIYYRVEYPYVDLLNPKVTEKFIENTHDMYKKHFQNEFGKTIKGIFTDEPQIHVSSLAWSIELSKAFKAMNGYDYLDELPLLFEEDNDDAIRYRYDYYQVVRQLFIHNYTEKLYDWANKNNLLLTGHFAGEEGLCIQTASNTGVMPHYELMNMPGIDSLGKRLNPPLLMKQVESIANQWGIKRVLSETFACTGNGVTFKELKQLWGYHLSFGVNFPCMSISMTNLSGIRKRDYPVFISKQQPWWEHFHYFSEWAEKANAFSTRGEDKAKVLLLSAINSTLYEKIFSLNQKIVSSNYRKTVDYLLNLQISFDIGDETLLAKHGKVINQQLIINKAAYHTIILPEQTGISETTLELLQSFKEVGGHIVQIQRFPTHMDGKRSIKPQEVLSKICDEVLQEREGILEKYWLKNQIQRDVHVTDYYGKTQTNLIIRTRYEGNYLLFTIFNRSNNPIEAYINIKNHGSINEINISDEVKVNKTSYSHKSMTIAPIKIESGELKFYEFTTEAVQNTEKELIDYIIYLKIDTVEPTHDNLLTLDYATYQCNYESSSKPLPLVHILKRLYQLANDYQEVMDVNINYSFHMKDILPLNLSIELDGCKKISVNRHVVWNELSSVPTMFLYDESFKSFEIGQYLIKGVNEINVVYEIQSQNIGADLENLHDSVRNKFSYPVSIESIYLSGKFDLEVIGTIEEDQRTVSVNGQFNIRSMTDKSIGDFISQNAYFYAGNIDYNCQYHYQNGRVYLKPHYHGVSSTITINGMLVTHCDNLNTVEVTGYLRQGFNKISIRVLGSLRNMMGPHHHISKEPEYTGIHTFTGEYGNGAIEDLSSNGLTENIWTDTYHFVKQGLMSVEIIQMK